MLQLARRELKQVYTIYLGRFCADLSSRWPVRAYDTRFLSGLECKDAGMPARYSGRDAQSCTTQYVFSDMIGQE
jgi:hypothetical protein